MEKSPKDKAISCCDLSRVSKFGSHGSLDGFVQIGALKDDEGGVASKLQGNPFHAISALTHQRLAHISGTFDSQNSIVCRKYFCHCAIQHNTIS